MEYHIDCAGVTSREALHRLLARILEFPDWYGCNLDALYDLLTDISKDTRLNFYHWNSISGFSQGFQKVLTEAECKNPKLHLYFHS